MTWQDAVIAAGQLLFIIALIPALRSPYKPPRVTCFITGATLFAFAFTFSTLNLEWATLTAAVCAALWMILLFQPRGSDAP